MSERKTLFSPKHLDRFPLEEQHRFWRNQFRVTTGATALYLAFTLVTLPYLSLLKSEIEKKSPELSQKVNLIYDFGAAACAGWVALSASMALRRRRFMNEVRQEIEINAKKLENTPL